MAYSLTLNVQYNANGGSGAPSSSTRTVLASSLPHAVSVTIPPATPTRSGYTFLGWSANSSASSASYSAGGSYSYTFAEEGTRTTTLYAVWSARKSTISLHDGTTAATIDDQTVIDITRYNNSYTHTITYAFGNASGTIANKTSNTSITWPVPASLASQIPSATKATCTLTCTTYRGNTSLGTTTLTITLFVKQSVKVTIGSVSISEGYASMPSGISVYVLGKSKLTFLIPSVSTNAYGATVASISTTVDGKTYSGSSFTTDALASGTSNRTVSYSITMTDSRGRTDTKTGSITAYGYHSPTPVITSVVRDAANPTRAIVSYTWNVSSINNQNAKTLKVLYKLTTASSYSQATSITPSAYSGSSTYTLNPSPSGLDAAYPYNVQIQLTDSFTTVSYTLTLASSGSRYIECDIPTQTVKFPLNAQVVGDLTVNGSINNIGETQSTTPDSSSLANNSWVGKASLTFSPGVYVLEGGCRFAANANGYRAVVLASSNNSSTILTRGARTVTPAIEGVAVVATFTMIREFTEQTTLYVNAYQNSGSALTVYPWFRSVRIY